MLSDKTDLNTQQKLHTHQHQHAAIMIITLCLLAFDSVRMSGWPRSEVHTEQTIRPDKRKQTEVSSKTSQNLFFHIIILSVCHVLLNNFEIVTFFIFCTANDNYLRLLSQMIFIPVNVWHVFTHF